MILKIAGGDTMEVVDRVSDVHLIGKDKVSYYRRNASYPTIINYLSLEVLTDTAETIEVYCVVGGDDRT
jgi:hypothetical protein